MRRVLLVAALAVPAALAAPASAGCHLNAVPPALTCTDPLLPPISR